MGRTLLGVVLLAVLSVAPVSSAAPRPLQTAISEAGVAAGTDSDLALARTRAAGTNSVYVMLYWNTVAPATRPAVFDSANHLEPAYAWASYDERLRRIAAHGLKPIVVILHAPPWAEGAGDGPAGTNRPSPVEFGRFARAAATRYNGLQPGLPRVRYWQLWSEPNLFSNLNPQWVGGQAYAVTHYRRLLEEATPAIRAVHSNNVVIAGGLAPFSSRLSVAPLRFMRQLFCLNGSLRPTCRSRAPFDIWSHHPYTSGGPTHSAFLKDDASLGDMPAVRRTLNAAVRYRRIASPSPGRLWVTEFSWDTKPPDPMGVPIHVHTYWVAEALYRMWQNGVSLVVWHQLRDNPTEGESLLQSGLYFRGSSLANDRPKPSLRAFRFPLVALPRPNGLYVWARTPAGQPGRVIVERRGSGAWRRLGTVRTNSVGILSHTFRGAPKSGVVRARTLGDQSAAFPLKRIKDFYVQPFGCWSFPCSTPGPPG